MVDLVLRTERLRLRPAAPQDLSMLRSMWTDPEVRSYLFDDREISEEEAAELLGASVSGFADRKMGVWLVSEKESTEPIGFAGVLLREIEPPDLVYGLLPSATGRGYATEAAHEVIRYVFEELGLERVKADVDEPNVASVRVLEKLGMRFSEKILIEGRPVLYYSLRRSAS